MKTKANIPKALIGFLIVSTLSWLLINLSKEYTTTISYKVDYKAIAQDKILQENPINKIDIIVKATGFKLLSANFRSKKITFLADKLTQKGANNYFFSTKSQQEKVQGQLLSGLKLQQILPDTIYLKLGSLQTKKVPVIADLAIQYQLGYNKVKNVAVKPDSVLISGPELQLKEIKNLKTTHLELQGVSKNISKKLKIKLPEKAQKIKLNQTEVEISIVVDKFTEGTFELPVEVKNIPKGMRLNTFPKQVKVIYKIGLKKFNQVTKNSFNVVCDYQESKTNELTYLIPKISLQPNVVSSVRIVPEKIDFLIQK